MTVFYRHIHHDILIEPLTEPIENRIAFIKANKPVEEIETRLRLMRPVKGSLPAAYTKARAAYEKAWAAYTKAWAAYTKARAAYTKAWAAYTKARAAYEEAWAACMPELEALHAIECPDCPWDGHTIFPKVRS